MTVAMVTAIYDRYEELKPAVEQTVDTEWVLVTDDPAIEDGTLGWRVVYEPRPGVTPMRAAKRAKFTPWQYTAAPASIWLDGSAVITSPELAEVFLAAADPVASFRHPQRNCIYPEAEVSATMRRYAGEPVLAQAEAYWETGHPTGWGLWETTILARHHTPEVIALGDAWAAEMERWSSQDQVSFPFILRQCGLRAGTVEGWRCGSPWHEWGGSDRH